MKKLFIIPLLMLLCLPMPAQRLTILHTNDTHSHLDPLRDGTGGIIERAAFVDSVRTADGRRHVLLLHAGDFNQGSSYYTILKGELEVDILNAMKYDCICFGNHEFDNGIEDLTRRVRRIRPEIVCCNYDFSPFELGQYVKPCTIIRRGGMKIGIIGALCDITTVVSREISDRIPQLDTVTEVNRWASWLKDEQKCDLVILLSHLGYKGQGKFPSDCSIVGQTRGVDIIVGGHSHTLLKKMDESHADADGHIVPIVQDGSWGLQMGVLKIY